MVSKADTASNVTLSPNSRLPRAEQFLSSDLECVADRCRAGDWRKAGDRSPHGAVTSQSYFRLSRTTKSSPTRSCQAPKSLATSASSSHWSNDATRLITLDVSGSTTKRCPSINSLVPRGTFRRYWRFRTEPREWFCGLQVSARRPLCDCREGLALARAVLARPASQYDAAP